MPALASSVADRLVDLVYSLKPQIFLAIVLLLSSNAEAKHFKVGFAKQDITPTKPTPMWGYGARHAALSTGVRDPLYAKAVVIDVGTQKLAIVGRDLGRSPTDAMMVRIRDAIRTTSEVGLIMISGSHTHHGPVIELLDEAGKAVSTVGTAL